MARPAQIPRHVILPVRKCTFCLWHPRRWHTHVLTLVRFLIAGPLMGMSATCIEFGRSLLDQLGEDAPPIGLIASAVGGTRIESWSPVSTAAPAARDSLCGILSDCVLIAERYNGAVPEHDRRRSHRWEAERGPVLRNGVPVCKHDHIRMGVVPGASERQGGMLFFSSSKQFLS